MTLMRYIMWRAIKGLCLAFLIVTSIIMIIDFVESSRDLGDIEGMSSFIVMKLTLLKTPQLIEQTVPFVVLFGIMGTLYSMNRRSELIVMRASGLSAWKFLTPITLICCLLGMVWTIGLNPLASKFMQLHNTTLAQIEDSESTQNSASNPSQVWLREGSPTTQTVIRAESIDPQSLILNKVTFYRYNFTPDKGAVFTERIDAEQAVLLNAQFWQLKTVIINPDEGVTQFEDEVSLSTKITAGDLRKQTRSTSNPAFWNIPAEISEARQAGFSTTELHMYFNRLLSLPLTLIAMCFIAAAVSMRLTREGGTLKLMIAGAGLGFIVYFADNFISAFGEAGTLPVLLAAWSMPFLVLFTGVSYLAYLEDG